MTFDAGLIHTGHETVPYRVREDPHIEKGRPDPVHGACQIRNGLQHYLRVQVLCQVFVEERLNRDGSGGEAFVFLLQWKREGAEGRVKTPTEISHVFCSVPIFIYN